jgi:hypothetical protein
MNQASQFRFPPGPIANWHAAPVRRHMLGWWRGHPGGHASSYGRAAIADHLALMYGRMQRVRELVANVSFPPQYGGSNS